MKLLSDIPRFGARRFGDGVALQHGGRTLRYRVLDAACDRGASVLCAAGLASGRGGILTGNRIDYAVAYFSVARAGGVIVPFAPSQPDAQIERQAAHCAVDYLVTVPELSDRVRRVCRRISGVRAVVTVAEQDWSLAIEPISEGGSTADPGRGSDPVAVMLATSGTLSRPKRVMLSHHNLLANVDSFLEVARLEPGDRGLIALPFTASGTNTTELLAYLKAGVTSVIYPKEVFLPGDYFRLVESEQISVANVTPFIVSLMLERADQVRQKIRTLRKVFFASAPMSADRLRMLPEVFPDIRFYYGYGLTEASPRCTTLLPDLFAAKPGSCGTPLPGIEIRIVDKTRSPLPAGEIGEIAIRGPNVMLGYFGQEEETLRVLDSGWLYSGDLGLLDSDGCLFVKGRKKNTIISRGVSICAEEVEEALLAHPAVADACVHGEPDSRAGEALVALVVRRKGQVLARRQLRAHIASRLEPVKVPARIVWVDELPRSRTHKLVRARLQQEDHPAEGVV